MWNSSCLENPHCRSRKTGALLLATLAIAIVCGSLAGGPTWAAQEDLSEYTLKGAFLYNFALFAAWPEDAFQEEDSPLVIAVFRDRAVEETIRDAFQGKVIRGRPVALKRIDAEVVGSADGEVVDSADGEAVDSAHLLFVPGSEVEAFYEVRHAFAGLPVLLVGESRDFIERGGMLNFFIENNRVRFEASQQNAEHARVALSSKLLTLARGSR